MQKNPWTVVMMGHKIWGVFLPRNIASYPKIIPVTPSYLELCDPYNKHGHLSKKKLSAVYCQNQSFFWANFLNVDMVELSLFFLAHLTQRAIMKYCHCIRRASSINNGKQIVQIISFSIKPLDLQVSNFTWSMTWPQALRTVKLGQIEYPSWPPLLKTVKINFFSRTTFSFQTLRRGMNLRSGFGDTLNLCCI